MGAEALHRHGKAGTGKFRILIVDDHPIVRAGLREVLSRDPGVEVCGEVGCFREAWGAVERLKPDIAVVDISLPDRDGIELTKEMTRRYPSVKVLVLSLHEEFLYARRALAAGAKGYIEKKEAPEKIAEAVRQILRGKMYLSEQMTQKMLQSTSKSGRICRQQKGQADPPLDCLSNRELEVLRFIGKGYSRCRIAKALYLSPKTVDTYRDHLKKKLGLSDNAQLILFAAGHHGYGVQK